MGIGRGGAYVPARVAPQGRFYRSCPRTMRVFWYGNAAARTFGRAHRRRPYAFCLRELRVDVCPYGFVWADCVWVVDVVWVDCAWVVLFVGWLVKTVHMNQHHRCCTFDSPGLIERSEIYPG